MQHCVFKRKCIEHIWDYKQREYYEKPSEKRRKAKKAGIARARKRRLEDERKRNKFELVGDFMEAFGQRLKQNQLGLTSVLELRLELIDEEVEELRVAVANRDMVEIADALTDILYVVYGAGHTFGIDLDDCFDEVMPAT